MKPSTIRRGGSLPRRKRRRSGCLSRLTSGCLLLFSVLILSAIPCGIINQLYIIPAAEASQLENLPSAMRDATLYIKEMNQPVPDDVILSGYLIKLAEKRGYEEYQLQAVIAAADRMDIARADLLTIMDMEGGWPSDIRANTFIIALEKGLGLIELGYERGENKKNKLVFLEYFGDDQATLNLFLANRKTWSAANAARIRQLPPWVWAFWPGIVVKFWTYYNVGYGDLATLFGGGDLPPFPSGEIPDVPDDTFVNPYPGSGICGYSYGERVGNYRHWGIDLCKGGQDWVVAGHNCKVTFVGNIDRVSQRAVDWWVSGYTVACESKLDDGTKIWTVYGHGEPGTFQVDVGDRVRAGEVLMLSDSTGFSTGNHLHYGMKINGHWVNPALTLP